MTEDKRTEMTAVDVITFLDIVEMRGVSAWLDGGWAVDALLGKQTRKHADLDVVLEQRDINTIARALRRKGYSTAPRDDSRSTNFALGDNAGHEVDLHAVTLYPPHSLSATGRIGGRQVGCVAPEWLVAFHTRYTPDANDWADVSALCERFGIQVPSEFDSFREP